MTGGDFPGLFHEPAGGGHVFQPVSRQRRARRHHRRQRAASAHHPGHQRTAARHAEHLLAVGDVIHLTGNRHDGGQLTSQRLGRRQRRGGRIGGIHPAPAGAHPGQRQNFGGIPANGRRLEGQQRVTKGRAHGQGADRHRIQRPGLAGLAGLLHCGTHGHCAIFGQGADVD